MLLRSHQILLISVYESLTQESLFDIPVEPNLSVRQSLMFVPAFRPNVLL